VAAALLPYGWQTKLLLLAPLEQLKDPLRRKFSTSASFPGFDSSLTNSATLTNDFSPAFSAK
jgi:hypothetical protein